MDLLIQSHPLSYIPPTSIEYDGAIYTKIGAHRTLYSLTQKIGLVVLTFFSFGLALISKSIQHEWKVLREGEQKVYYTKDNSKSCHSENADINKNQSSILKKVDNEIKIESNNDLEAIRKKIDEKTKQTYMCYAIPEKEIFIYIIKGLTLQATYDSINNHYKTSFANCPPGIYCIVLGSGMRMDMRSTMQHVDEIFFKEAKQDLYILAYFRGADEMKMENAVQVKNKNEQPLSYNLGHILFNSNANTFVIKSINSPQPIEDKEFFEEIPEGITSIWKITL